MIHLPKLTERERPCCVIKPLSAVTCIGEDIRMKGNELLNHGLRLGFEKTEPRLGLSRRVSVTGFLQCLS